MSYLNELLGEPMQNVGTNFPTWSLCGILEDSEGIAKLLSANATIVHAPMREELAVRTLVELWKSRTVPGEHKLVIRNLILDMVTIAEKADWYILQNLVGMFRTVPPPAFPIGLDELDSQVYRLLVWNEEEQKVQAVVPETDGAFDEELKNRVMDRLHDWVNEPEDYMGMNLELDFLAYYCIERYLKAVRWEEVAAHFSR